MALAFWRKTKDIAPENAQAVAATEDTPLPVVLKNDEDDETPKVQLDQLRLPPVAGEQHSALVQIPGIATAAAYADGDAFGTLFYVPNLFRAEKPGGVITKVLLFDKDDEGLQVDLVFFRRKITGTADNDAFAPTDDDLLAWEGTLSVTTFYNWNANQGGQNISDRLWLSSDDAGIWLQCVARGALNIAAGAVPWLKITVVPD